ncbi:MAG: membrane protein insertion efficiency factor YidD [Candidatus Melainabacteria bacterium]|nr:membrane protein insertion efficiency factor YidD [Candidatus Melainabacteria bacterium]
MSKVKRVVLAVLSAWQSTRRFRQPACRFYPSCSQYAKQAIEKHGIAAGMRLGVVRICKCHPFHDGGVDEVPEVICQAAPAAWRRWHDFGGGRSRQLGGVPGRGTAPPLQIVMKSGLNPVFAGMKARIFAQAFCLKTPPAGDIQHGKNSTGSNCSTISNNLLANTSRSA